MNKIQSVVMECLEDCGETFILPVTEIISSEPATSGQIVITIRVDANNPEGTRLTEHMMNHWDLTSDERYPERYDRDHQES